ncbi:MAG: cation:proton antiporter [Prevotella sp.]|nr:cation:proton antiporter [Candidatus Equicola stercoris]
MKIPDLIVDLALILVTAGIVTLVFKKLKQPLVLGYIVAGFLVSPHMPYTLSVVDSGNIELWANIGVVFLLFALGLDFSFKKISKMGVAPIIAAVTIVFCMILIGVGVGNIFGWQRMDCVFLGGMLAMSSTTIIYKAFDDMGLRQQKFASMVMSVLILEDILAIVLMVILSAMAQGAVSGSDLFHSILQIGFYVVLWFVVGIFLIPLFLRATRKLMTSETLLVVALAFCFLMAVVAHKAGFSYAFGAFIMGSILSETIEADKIEKLVAPVKDLFGAIFFVSVGMMVEPNILVEYALPILAIVLAIIIGHALFSSTAYFISGQQLKDAVRCGFSMSQIGEFAFIIATLGLSLGVISKFLYPVVVAVSVITTFLTPYMIKAAPWAYSRLEKHLPENILNAIKKLSTNSKDTDEPKEHLWKTYIMQAVKNLAIFTVICVAIYIFCYYFVTPILDAILPGTWADWAKIFITLLCLSIFLRGIIMKKIRNDCYHQLYNQRKINRPILFLIIATRFLYAIHIVAFVIYTWKHLNYWWLFTLSTVIIFIIASSQKLRQNGKGLERIFMRNLNARESMAVVKGSVEPAYSQRLQSKNIHITDIVIPDDSRCCGQPLKTLDFGARFGVSLSSILRGSQRINIPTGDTILFPGDKIQVIGSDEQLMTLNKHLMTDIFPEDLEIEKREMVLRQYQLTEGAALIGKKLSDSGIRERYNGMLIGIDEGGENLTTPDPKRKFRLDDIIWIVGEEKSLRSLQEELL